MGGGQAGRAAVGKLTAPVIEYVPRGVVIAPFNPKLRLPFQQAEALHSLRPPVDAPQGIQVSEDYRPLFDDSLLGLIRHFALWGGRGGSKSWVAVLVAVLRMRRFPNYKVANVRQHQVSLDQSMHALYKGTIKRLGFEDEFHVTDNRITHNATGAEAIFKGIGINTDNIRSLEDVDLCIIEEASQLTKSGIETLVPTIRAPKAQFLWLWNPSEEGPQAVDLRFRAGTVPDDTKVIQVNFNTSNPHWFFASLVNEERQARKDKDNHAHIWLGEYPKASDALVFAPGDWSIGYCMVPAWCEPRHGMDFGFSPDPTVAVRVYVIEPEEDDETGVIYVDRCKAATNLSTRALPEFLSEVAPTGAEIGCDNSEPRTIEDLQGFGYNAFGAPKGPGSIKAGIKFIKGYHLRVSPDCDPILANELRNYRHKVDKATGKKLPQLAETGHDHAIDSVRYAIWDYVRMIDDGVQYA